MPVSTFVCIVVSLVILLASNQDITELRAKQAVARKALEEYRIKKARSKN